jgi:hypothetical protein
MSVEVMNMATTQTIQTGVALFKGHTAVNEPPKFYLPIVEFNRGASVAGRVVLCFHGADIDRFVVGRAYRVEYARESREVVRVLGQVDTDGALIQ